MKALNFLIICLITSNYTVSTSKDEQRPIIKKEDLPASNEPRKLDSGIYITAYFGGTAYYDEGFAIQRIPSRQSISKIILNKSNGESREYTKTDEISFGDDTIMQIYFDSPPESLNNFFFFF